MGDRRVIGHGGGFPGHATNTWFDPAGRMAVSVLINETAGPAAAMCRAIFKIINLALSAAPTTGQPAGVNLDGFTGSFANLSDVTDIVRFGDTLYSLNPSIEDPAGEVTELERVDGDTLRIKETPAGSLGETVRVVRDSSGRIAEIVHAGVTFYPHDVLSERLRDGVAPPS